MTFMSFLPLLGNSNRLLSRARRALDNTFCLKYIQIFKVLHDGAPKTVASLLRPDRCAIVIFVQTLLKIPPSTILPAPPPKTDLSISKLLFCTRRSRPAYRVTGDAHWTLKWPMRASSLFQRQHSRPHGEHNLTRPPCPSAHSC